MRIFSSFTYPDEHFRKIFPFDFESRENIKLFLNQSGTCDLTIILGFAPLGSWVRCRKQNIHKVVVEPWHEGIFYRYVRKHAGYFAEVHTPHEFLDEDPRVETLEGNLDYHYEYDWDQLRDQRFPKQGKKSRLISSIMSAKSDLPGHNERRKFLDALCLEFPELVRYGRGTEQELSRKKFGLDDFKYSVAMENSFQLNYFTEKIYDPFLSWTVPIYWGAPNIGEFFPSRSFIQIDFTDFEGSVRSIRSAIEDPEDYPSRLSDLKKARESVLENHLMSAFVKKRVQKLERFGLKKIFLLASLDTLLHRLRDLGFWVLSKLKTLRRNGLAS